MTALLSLSDAAWWTEHVMVEHISEAFDDICQAPTVGAADKCQQVFIVLHDIEDQEGHEKLAFEIFVAGKPVRGGVDDPETFEEWMRSESVSNGIVIHTGQMAFNLRGLMDEVISNRNRDWWRDELRDYLQAFKRPKEQPKTVSQLISDVAKQWAPPPDEEKNPT